jgi:hypothetical protein
MKIYLDNCSFNRPFDDQSQIRIRLESEAKLKIQEEIRSGTYKLIWSYILDYENDRNPFQERKEQISKWKKYAIEDIAEDDSIIDAAIAISQKGMKKIDSLHIACAIKADADYFLTTDDGTLKRTTLIEDIKITDPIGFIKEILA